MTTKTIRYVVLDVGQGTGQFVEIYNTSDQLTNTILIDLGSESRKNEAGIPSVDYLTAKLAQMASPKIDFVFFSHSDSDHINLIPDLLDNFDPPSSSPPTKTVLEIGEVFYGGPRNKYTKKGTNILRLIEAYTIGKIRGGVGQWSSYNPTANPPVAKVFREIGVVKLYVLITNTPKPSGKPVSSPSNFDGYALNTFSLVVVLDIDGTQYIATGDATGATIAACNERIASSFFPLVVMLSMPHHGSETTAFNLTGSSGGRDNALAVANIQQFSDSLNAQTITASAERKRNFKHPSAYLMSFFWQHVTEDAYTDPTLSSSNAHYYTAFFKPEDGFEYSDDSTGMSITTSWPSFFSWWYTVQSNKNVFTNLYYDQGYLPFPLSNQTIFIPPDDSELGDTPASKPYPPLGVQWVYTSDSSGQNVTLTRETNRPSLAATHISIAQAKRMHSPKKIKSRKRARTMGQTLINAGIKKRKAKR